jgi:putative heme-binding domain-containing protein
MERYVRAMWIVPAVIGCLLVPDAARAQGAKNPLEGNQDAVRRGSLLFRARCAGCHGLDARGVSGPDLTAVLSSGASDQRLFRTVRNGVTGTEMPRFGNEQTTDTQVWEILTYLHSLTSGGAAETVSGNAENGARVFQTHCAACHLANGKGGHLGPELSRIGTARSVSALRTKIRNPGRSMVAGYRPVTLVMNDGRRVRGLRKNEDAFTIQIMDMTERIQGYSKSDIREIISEPRSPMPVFDAARLSDSDLNDLLSHLLTLRGPQAIAAQ